MLIKATEGSRYWTFSIPHYNRAEDFTPTIPSFTKGQSFAILTLRDNSKVWINASSQSEAEGVVRQLSTYIDPSQLPRPLKIHTGERKGDNLATATVEPVRAMFFATGQQNMAPDWLIEFNQEEEEGDGQEG